MWFKVGDRICVKLDHPMSGTKTYSGVIVNLWTTLGRQDQAERECALVAWDTGGKCDIFLSQATLESKNEKDQQS